MTKKVKENQQKAKNSHGMFRKKHPSKKNEHEILMDELYDNSKSENSKDEKAFDFTSINDYNSIFKYKKSNSLLRQTGSIIDYDSKPVQGVEKLINYFIISLFYLLLIIFLPFSLIICLKKIKENEKLVVYRLGRLVSPSYKPGFCVLFPFIDNYQRYNTSLKEFTLPNVQILNYENAIIETSFQVRYQINDAEKMTNSVKDPTFSLKSISRSLLVSMLSKKDANKIELDKAFLKQEIKEAMNDHVRKWGVEITDVELTINGIAKDESSEPTEDPALKSISLVFKSLLNNTSMSSKDETKPSTSADAKSDSGSPFSTDFLRILQTISPVVVPSDQLLQNLNMFNGAESGSESVATGISPSTTMTSTASSTAASPTSSSGTISPFQLLKLFQPLINENVVREVQTVYEFHLSMKNDDETAPLKTEVFHLDLKYAPKGHIGFGPYLAAKADCIIKINDQDLNDLLTDKLKPFTAYMSGRIEIYGDLQDVFKLKKLIKSVTTLLSASSKKAQLQQT